MLIAFKLFCQVYFEKPSGHGFSTKTFSQACTDRAWSVYRCAAKRKEARERGRERVTGPGRDSWAGETGSEELEEGEPSIPYQNPDENVALSAQ